ncbi:DUF6881 domain-containing protein [Aliiroseovarius crassostreae]|uniref:DUF6881 domain-containing protein n=1 Tax=Aliiroseovarius crassostreae TaxID=154981 RepID=UPI0022066437|nr:hypothetical protein [Aliiroseovarius crassostreae]UWQ06667.1 hypothetical protein K3X22_15365 [Aliiroseovarius crassostreae]
MYYLKITYKQDFDSMSRVQYCEIGDGLYAMRCIEELRNGQFGCASQEHPTGTNGVVLPQGVFPEKDALWSLEGEFTAEEISRDEFYDVWVRVAVNS